MLIELNFNKTTFNVKMLQLTIIKRSLLNYYNLVYCDASVYLYYHLLTVINKRFNNIVIVTRVYKQK